MRAAKGAMIAVALVLALVACSPKEPKLLNIRSETNGPDEFSILPPKALQQPEDLVALPEPTPGGFSRTDPTPTEDAIIALGGRAQGGNGIPGRDGALVAQATRFGTAGDIRQTLATEDLEFRRKNDGRLLERIFAKNVYYRAYKRQSLDQDAELARWRRAGAGNPSATPLEALQ